jgi:DNA-directed RNA polymerase specialized sigma24 family protein
MAKPKLNKTPAVETLDFSGLVDIVRMRGRASKVRINAAYNEIELRMRPKIKHIVSQFFIPGCNADDIYQEALFALRFEAILKYDKERATKAGGPYPFDKFAALIIRRRLSSLLKSCFQQKRRPLNTSVSLDQNRNEDGGEDDSSSLNDVLPVIEGDMLVILEKKEYQKQLFGTLFTKLSKFEKKVYLLYIQRHSYIEMSVIINKEYKIKKLKRRINIKSIDNSLSRIKQKLLAVYEKYKKENPD